MTSRAESDIVARIAEILVRRGAQEYLGEDVTVADHMLQTAAHAEQAGAPDALVAAALLHDIGHFTGEFGSYAEDDVIDRYHHEAGAEMLAGRFPPLVVESVRLHVAAKRYLCAVEPDYRAGLSTASRHSLALQGGPMRPADAATFRRLEFFEEAVAIRRWDDRGKVPGRRAPSLDHFLPLLERVAGTGRVQPQPAG